MTIDDLIEELGNLSAAGHGDATVRLAEQPNYPSEYSINGMKLHKTNQSEIDELESLISNNNYPEDKFSALEQLEQLKQNNETVLYIREGSYLDYLSGDIWDD